MKLRKRLGVNRIRWRWRNACVILQRGQVCRMVSRSYSIHILLILHGKRKSIWQTEWGASETHCETRKCKAIFCGRIFQLFLCFCVGCSGARDLNVYSRAHAAVMGELLATAQSGPTHLCAAPRKKLVAARRILVAALAN